LMYENSYCTGLIRERNWYGPDGMVHLRTIKEPKQAIPTFTETLDLLMKVRAA
jgi:phosphatidylglycerol phospholipase C